MSFPRYPKYRESGVEWLGEVPEEWSVTRLRFVAELNPSKSEIADLDRATPVSFLPMESVGDDGSLNLEREKPIAEVENGYTYFREGDVTLAKITPCFENGKGAVMHGLTNGVGFGTTELIVARPRAGRITSDYLHLLFTSAQFRRMGEASMYGAGGQKRVPDAFVRNAVVAVPPVADQRPIVCALKTATSRLDALIAEQERLIELLREKRQAVISHAVTKGLNPDAPMKPSGVEWLGDIPDHWRVWKLSRAFDVIGSGTTPDTQRHDYYGGDIAWVNTGDLNDRDLLACAKRVTQRAVTAYPALRIYPSGSVVIAMYGATIGKLATLCLPAAVNQACCVFAGSSVVRSRFLYYWLLAHRHQIVSMAIGGGQPNINQEMLRSLRAAVPHVAEQDDIAVRLDEETTRYAALVAEAERAIALLHERRSALISAAVTGKIDVRCLTTTHADAAGGPA